MKETWKRSIYQSQDPTDRPKVATFSFKGTAVYVNTITNVQTGAGVPGNSDMTFLLDDQVSYFISKAPGFPIAQTVFSATGLVDKYHNLTIVNGHPNSSFAQVMMFLDSIIYTTEFLPLAGPTRPKDNAPSRPNIRLVIGVSVGVGGLILGLLSCWLFLRVRARKVKARQSISALAFEARISSMQRVAPFLAYKSPIPGQPETFDGRETGTRSPLTALLHRPETIVSIVPPSYRSRRSAGGVS
ncbi:hypothetical protein PTI98_001863 [Pleurotus ostreatus]|nr:hypothetical protein PTI98_001863 [Pleurotus ostreatus]